MTGESGGLDDGWETPSILKGIIDNEEFVNRFVFDGEQARKTLSSGNEEAEKAIVYLYQINKFDDLINEVDKLVKIKQEHGIGKNTSRSMKVLLGKYQTRENTVLDLKQRLNKASNQLRIKEAKKKEYEIKYRNFIEQDNNFNEKKQKIDEKLKRKEIELSQSLKRILYLIKKPYNISHEFAQRLESLASNMQVLKLPKSTAREFFNEIAEGAICICGRCIGEKERENILNNADHYLGQEELVALNAIKGSLKEIKVTNELSDSINNLEEISSTLRELENDYRLLEEEMVNKGNEEIADIQNNLQKIDVEIKKLQNEVLLLETKDFTVNAGLDKDNNIYLAEKAFEEAKENYLRAIGTYEFTMKAEKIKDYLKEIRNNALESLKKRVIEETNNKISNIIKNDDITIKKIDHHLILDGREAVSEGQTLAIAYAYIGSLFEHAVFEFPFIVDSPAAAMDLQVRREIAKVIPNLFNQLIIFVTSGEVKGFAEMFYKRDDVQYITLKGGKDNDVECKFGREYFARYQDKEGTE